MEVKTRGLGVLSVMGVILALLFLFLVLKAKSLDFDEFELIIVLMLTVFGLSALSVAVILLLSIRKKSFLELLGPGMFAGFTVAIVII